MTTLFKTTACVFAIGALTFFSSCKDEEPEPTPQTFAKPTISIKEVGDSNSKKAKAGEDLHVDAEIVAEGKIAKIKIELHPETAGGDEIEAEYPEYDGLKNLDFHKDLDIPATAKKGEYHFHIMVTDQQGQTTKAEVDGVEIE